MLREQGGLVENTQEDYGTPFERHAIEIEMDGLALMDANHGPESENKKVFHTIEHPKGMIERASPMKDAFHLSPESRALVNDIIAYHDVDIYFDKPDEHDLLGTIKRHRGARAGDKPSGAEGNEGKSADELEARMRKANEEAGGEIFSEDNIKLARLGIDFTYPDVLLGPDFKGQVFKELPHFEEVVAMSKSLEDAAAMVARAGIDRGALFIQPHLDNMIEHGEPVPPEALIVALADLGEAGSERFEVFKRGGNGEFQELYPNISNPDTLSRLAHGDAEADDVDRERVVKKFQEWLTGQISFAFGQMIRFEKNMLFLRRNGTLNEETEGALRQQFSRFQENIGMAIDRRDQMNVLSSGRERDKTVFQNFASEMGYKIFSMKA